MSKTTNLRITRLGCLAVHLMPHYHGAVRDDHATAREALRVLEAK